MTWADSVKMTSDEIETDNHNHATHSGVHPSSEHDDFPRHSEEGTTMIEPQPFAPAFGIPPPHLAGLWGASPMIGASQVVMDTHLGHPIVYPAAPHRDISGAGLIPTHPTQLMQPGMIQLLVPNSNPVDPLENVLGVFPCVKLNGLPKAVTIDDILLFFSGLVLIDVVLPFVTDHENENNSNDMNEAFVLFSNPMDFQMGLQRDHQLLGHQYYVEVSQGKRHEYYEAVSARVQAKQHEIQNEIKKLEELDGEEEDKELPPVNRGNFHQQQHMGKHHRGNNHSRLGTTGGGIQHGVHSGYLRMRGLPFSASQEDILKFFAGYKIVEDSVVFTFKSDGRATGEAYVKFCSPDEARRAMSKNKELIGSRYIELFIATLDEHMKSVTRYKSRKDHI